MALPLGEAGINEIPNESAVLVTDAALHRAKQPTFRNGTGTAFPACTQPVI
jgi:hypothetical protein